MIKQLTPEQKKRKRILKGLNPAQKEAVAKTLKTPTLVIAGAGSGKTRVLTKRVSYILAKGASPRDILTVTFTNKAAKEMRERISDEVGAEQAAKLTIGTFHSLCVRWLHQYYNEAGLKKSWTIADEDEQKKLMKSILKDMNIESTASSVSAHLGTISTWKNDMKTPEKVRKEVKHSGDLQMYNVYKKYQDRLQRINACDFDDLIMKMVQVLEFCPEVRRKFQKRFQFVMVDEYQDTNECQYRLIKLIVGNNNIFVVGL